MFYQFSCSFNGRYLHHEKARAVKTHVPLFAGKKRQWAEKDRCLRIPCIIPMLQEATFQVSSRQKHFIRLICEPNPRQNHPMKLEVLQVHHRPPCLASRMRMTELQQTCRSMSTPCLSLASMASAQVLVKSWTNQNQAEEDGEFAVQSETTFASLRKEFAREAFFRIPSPENQDI